MTILNFQQNNYRNTLTVQHNTTVNAAQQSRKADLLLQLVSSWLEHLLRRNGEAGSLISFLQEAAPATPHHEHLSALARLQQQSADDLQKLTALLRGEGQHTLSNLLPPSGAGQAWIWLSLQYFFEEWNPETADYHLWLLTRPVLCAEAGTTTKEREEAASFYELTKLLISAAQALHQQQATALPAS